MTPSEPHIAITCPHPPPTPTPASLAAAAGRKEEQSSCGNTSGYSRQQKNYKVSHTASPCVGSFVQCRYIHREPLYIVHCIVNSDCPRLICVLVRPATYKERCRSSARVQELRKDGSYAEQPQRCQHGESARRMIAQGGNQPCGEKSYDPRGRKGK